MRRGSTLIEMSAMLGICALIFTSAFDGLVRLQRLAAVDPGVGTRVELACAQLRRDLAAGLGRRVGDDLHVVLGKDRPEVVWRVEDGKLLRDGALKCPVTAFAIAIDEAGVSVTLAPRGLPVRRIEGLR